MIAPKFRAAAALFALACSACPPAFGREADWQPPGLTPAHFSVAEVLTAYERGRNSQAASQSERFQIRSGSTVLDATALISGLDYRIDVTIGDADYAMGRSQMKRWRRAPDGVVRIIESDVQGDDLDRWPEALLGFDSASCSPDGQTETDWVLECDPPGDIAHWYYADKSSGRIVREISRDGTRIVTYTFDKPDHWTISGAGGDADVQLLSEQSLSTPARTAIPASATNIFAMPANSTSFSLDAGFSPSDRFMVPVTVNGRSMRFFLDTGTTPILMDRDAAARAGLKPVFGHAIAQQVAVGGVVAQNLPIETVDLFGGRVKGILGNEFFKGHVVHIYYEKHQLDLIASDSFTPPPKAYEVFADYSEGMPLVSAAIGTTRQSRFAIDTGSSLIVLDNSFQDAPASASIMRLFPTVQTLNYLEGPVHVRGALVDSLQFANVSFSQPEVDIVQPQKGDLDIPLSGILGTALLSQFEWWFDYDGNRLWVRF